MNIKANIKERVKTGISGFDELLHGGIPQGSLVIITGSCGTGKTTMGMQFLYEGAKNGEGGVYVSMEGDPERVVNEMELYGWDIKPLINKKKLLLVRTELYKFDALINTIEDSIDAIKAKRLVIDPVSVLSFYFDDELKIRRNILRLSNIAKQSGVTTILISEIPEDKPNALSFYGVEEFVSDGVVALYHQRLGNVFTRYLVVKKMKGTSHSNKLHPMEITKNGVKIHADEEVLLTKE